MSATLAELDIGQSGLIAGFTTDNAITHRLMQLGLIDGTSVEIVRRAPAGDPIEVRLFGYALSLRASEAATVLIERTA